MAYMLIDFDSGAKSVTWAGCPGLPADRGAGDGKGVIARAQALGLARFACAIGPSLDEPIKAAILGILNLSSGR